MRAKTIILLWSTAISVGVSGCASPPAQQVSEPTATISLTIVELPPQTPLTLTSPTQAPPTDSTSPVPDPTTTLERTPSANETVPALSTDPHLEPGFPIEIGESPYDLPMVLGNIDNNPSQEIVVTTGQRLARQLLALKADGSPVDGWPLDGEPKGMVFNPMFSLGEFSRTTPGLEVVSYLARPDPSGYPMEWGIGIYAGSGTPLPGWPLTYPVVGSTSGRFFDPPLVVDLDGDGLDEVFAGNNLYRADGSIIPGWEGKLSRGIAGDLDQDGRPEIITNLLFTEGTQPVKAYRADGSLVTGFAPQLPQSWTNPLYPVVGDVDGDGAPEVIIAFTNMHLQAAGEPHNFLAIISADGQIKHISNYTDSPNAFSEKTNLALGDLDCDGAAEIVLQSATKLHVWRGDGSTFPGWPQDIGRINAEYSPLIGDVDGDERADIVVLTAGPSGQPYQHELRAYNGDGQLLSGFPKLLGYGRGATPAIADIDQDGRNEIIVAANTPPPGEHNTVWAFDLHGPGPYGAVQWGQYLGGPQHQSYFKPGTSCSK